MAFNSLVARLVAHTAKKNPDLKTVIELGNQRFVATDDCLKSLVNLSVVSVEFLQKIKNMKKVERHPLTAEFYQSLGFDQYNAIDVNTKFGSLAMDLNYNLKEKYDFDQTFDMVTNVGTGEHIFNQCAVFENIHQLTKVGAVMIHVAPFLGWVNHGFYNYHPFFYLDLAQANGYDVLVLGVSDRLGKGMLFQNNFSDHDVLENQVNVSLDTLLSHANFKALGKISSVRLAVNKMKHRMGMLETPYLDGQEFALRLSRMWRQSKDLLVFSILKKKKDTDFVVPMQGSYVSHIESDEIKEKYAAQA